MRAYVAGDEAAFDQLYRRYHGLLRGYLRRGYLRESDVRDLIQQTFLQLHRARRDYRADMPFRPWLMTIARNVKRDHLRRERRRPEFTALLEQHAGHTDPGADRVALREALAAATRLLPESLRRVFEAYWVEHLSHAEIARRHGISPAAARVRVHRAYRALRLSLSKYGYKGPPGT